MMEEYEVDLRDYFRVIWRKKWLILGVSLGAILIAFLASFRLPSQYQSEALLHLDTPRQISPLVTPALSAQMAVTILKSSDLLSQLVTEGGLATEEPFRDLSLQQSIKWLADHLRVSVVEGTPLIRVEFNGPLLPQLIERTMVQYLKLAKEELAQEVVEDARRDADRLSLQISILEGERAKLLQEVEEKIAEQRALLERQREELLQQLNAIEAGKAKLGLQVGELLATLEGVILREKFVALNSRLQRVEQGLIDLEIRGREAYPYLHNRISVIDQQIADLRIAVAEALKLSNSGWEPLTIVSQPTLPEVPTGPSRTMNLAVAGVLGLFVGVLLAFFVHWLQASPAQGKPGQPAGRQTDMR